MRNSFNYLYVLLCFISACSVEHASYMQFQGETMGTYYRLIVDSEAPTLKDSIEKILFDYNKAVSTYDPTSIISIVNGTESNDIRIDTFDKHLVSYFLQNFELAKEMHESSNGYFEPTVMPLLRYFGFGDRMRDPNFVLDSSKVLELKDLVGFEKVQLVHVENQLSVLKLNPDVSIDFSASAKGFGIDIIADFLDNQGLENYLIDIGGENRAKGENNKGKIWTTGINTPSDSSDLNDFEAILQLENVSIATSGNYRNWYRSTGDNRKIVHTINPFTGFFEINELLSASVIHSSCGRADALATACMSMGLAKAKALIEEYPDAECLLIYSDENGDLRQYRSENLTILSN